VLRQFGKTGIFAENAWVCESITGFELRRIAPFNARLRYMALHLLSGNRQIQQKQAVFRRQHDCLYDGARRSIRAQEQDHKK
jgi:hypothetical protein